MLWHARLREVDLPALVEREGLERQALEKVCEGSRPGRWTAPPPTLRVSPLLAERVRRYAERSGAGCRPAAAPTPDPLPAAKRLATAE